MATCRGFLQCVLKILNFFLTMVGAAMVLYSLWMLHEWYKYSPESAAPAPAPVDDFSAVSTGMNVGDALKGLQKPSIIETVAEPGEIQIVGTLSFVMEQSEKLKLAVSLPAPWVIYAFLGTGIVACVVTCVGHIAAETASTCCLCFYTVLLIILVIVQGAITAVIFFDNTWKDDIPNDPTGQLEKIYAFIDENYDICKWVGLAVLIIQALALLFSLILRAVADTRRSGYDSDDDYLPRTQRQALQRQTTTAGNGAAGDTTAETRPPARNDEWSKRMREKYGLDTNEFTYNPSESRRFVQQSGGTAAAPGEEKKNCCAIM
ncbi:unnamed protein product [Calypogeia fissa]